MIEELKIKLKVEIGDALNKIKQVKQAFTEATQSSNIDTSLKSASDNTNKLRSSMRGLSAVSFGGVVASLKGIKTAQSGVSAAIAGSQVAMSALARSYKSSYEEMASTAAAFKDKTSWIYQGPESFMDWPGEAEALELYNTHMQEAQFYLKNYNAEMAKATKTTQNFNKASVSSGKSVQSSSKTLSAFAKKAAIVVGVITAIIAALTRLGKAALEFNKQWGKVITAFQSMGATTKEATIAYNGLYRFLGDTKAATEASALLAKITTNEKELAEWTKICQGAYASFGDSLPIEGFIEASNESLRVGKVTGQLADALNWAGASEDAFNKKLAATNSFEQREILLRETLNKLYSNAAEIYEKNNKSLLEYNESQARLDTAVGNTGAVIVPLLSAINNLGTAFLNVLKPALDIIVPILTTFVNLIARAVQAFANLFTVVSGTGVAVSAVSSIANGFKDVESSAEAARRQVMGFDELNVLEADTGSSASSAVSPDLLSFNTQIEQGKAGVTSLFDLFLEKLQPSIEAWKSAFEQVKNAWNIAKPDFINGATEIQNGFQTLGDYLLNTFIPDVLNSFSTNLAPIVGDVFSKVVEIGGKAFSGFGTIVNSVITTIIIPRLELFKTIATGIFSAINSAWNQYGASFLKEAGKACENIGIILNNVYKTIVQPILTTLTQALTKLWNVALSPLVEKILKALLAIGTDLLKLYNTYIAPIVQWLQTNIFPIIINLINILIKTVGNLLANIADAIGGTIDVLQGLIGFITGVFTGDWQKAWDSIKLMFSGWKTTMESLIGGVLSVLQGLVSFVATQISAAFKLAVDGVKTVWGSVASWFKTNVWDKLVNIFGGVANWFKGVFSNAWHSVKGVFADWGTFFSGLWNTISSTFTNLGTKMGDAIGKAIKAGINGVISSIENTVNKAVDLINGAISLINLIPGVKVGKVSRLKLPRLAKGGIVDSATIAMIGERGKEAIVPLENNTEWIDKLAERLGANNQPSKIVLNVDGKELGWANIRSINSITKQTGELQLVLV